MDLLDEMERAARERDAWWQEYAPLQHAPLPPKYASLPPTQRQGMPTWEQVEMARLEFERQVFLDLHRLQLQDLISRSVTWATDNTSPIPPSVATWAGTAAGQGTQIAAAPRRGLLRRLLRWCMG